MSNQEVVHSDRAEETGEKLKDRLFNEAEQAAAEGEKNNTVETAVIPDTGLPDAHEPEPKKRGRNPLPEDLPRGSGKKVLTPPFSRSRDRNDA